MTTKRPLDDDGGELPPHKRVQALPHMHYCTPWTVEEISSTLPPLPPLNDSQLESRVFTHDSFDQNNNYEMLEWVGDAWLELIATNLIYLTFGHAKKSGRCSQIRELLIRNKTLARYAHEYGLDKRAKVPKDILDGSAADGKGRSKGVTLEKIHGDIFEAYVGALILSDPENGAKTVADWLKALWSRELAQEFRTLAKEHSSRPGTQTTNNAGGDGSISIPATKPSEPPKVMLAKKISVPGVNLAYKDMPSKKKNELGLQLFSVGVYLTGWGVTDELLGVGSALKKSEAGSIAATQALENKKLMKKFGAKKEALMKAKEEAKASANGQ